MITDHVTVSGSKAMYGGGMYNMASVTIESTAISNCEATERGGGIYNETGESDQLKIFNSTFTGNSTPSTSAGNSHTGGAIFIVCSYSGEPNNKSIIQNSTFSGNSGYHGGAIDLYNGAMEVMGSTFTGNSSTNMAAAVFVQSSSSNTCLLRNCTFINNTGEFGIIVNNQYLTMEFCTVYDNTSTEWGAVVERFYELTISNCLLAGNDNGSGTPMDFYRWGYTVTNNGNNIVEFQDGGNYINSSTDILWDAEDSRWELNGSPTSSQNLNIAASLANNGGPTQTLAISSGSFAIGAGNYSSDVLTDQRGATRSNPTTIGAYEEGGTLPASSPTVTTTSITNITPLTATSGGEVTADGGGPVLARGVVWNTSGTPTIIINIGSTSDGTGTGSFISSLTGLSPNTTYYVRAYATNGSGTSYGDELNFLSGDASVPTVTTTAVSAITSVSASSGGNVTDDGNLDVTAKGIVWNTTGSPTLDDYDGYSDDGTGTGSYSSTLTGLNPETTYYVRAYATNGVGTSYGSEETFETLTLPWIAVEDFETGNFLKFPWTFAGDADWIIDTDNTNNGNFSAKSDDISDDETSTMEVTLNVTDAGSISFYLKVSSEEGYDYLYFYINGDEQDSWSGEIDWDQTSFDVSAGENTFTWSYEKDDSTDDGDDCAWVDDIVFPAFDGEITWDGSESADWDTPENWDIGILPAGAFDVLIPDVSGTPGASAPIISGTPGANCHDMTVQTDASLSIQSGGSLITYGTIIKNGTINIEREITESVWHLISIPCSGITANTFLNEYLQSWDEANGVWEQITDPVETLNTKQGYALWAEPGKGNTTFTFSGTPLTGNQSIGITKNGTSGNFIGANLLGNPYPSSIDWNQLNEAYGANYIWDGTAYKAHTAVDGYDLGYRYIPPMQGFFIVTGSEGSFDITNDSRTHSGAENFYKSGNKKKLSNGLVLQASNGTYNDELGLIFKDEASSSFELPRDAWKMPSSTPGLSQLWSVSPDGNLSIDVRPETETIQLGFTNDQAGIYTIALKEIADIPNAILEDTKLNTFHDLQKSSYEFAWNPELDGENRFKLHLKSVGIEETPIGESNILIYAANNQIFIKGAENGKVIVSDIMGRIISYHEISSEGLISIPGNLKTGVYLVTVNSGNGVKTEKIFIN